MNFLKRFCRNRGAVFGLVILLAVVAFALLAPTLYPQSPWRPVGRPFLWRLRVVARLHCRSGHASCRKPVTTPG